MYREILLQQLVLSSQGVPRCFDARVLSLAQDLERNGLVRPLQVRPRLGADVVTMYEVFVGKRRFLAAQSLGWAALECRVLFIDDAEAERLSLLDNLRCAILGSEQERDRTVVMRLLDIYSSSLDSLICDLGAGITSVEFRRYLSSLSSMPPPGPPQLMLDEFEVSHLVDQIKRAGASSEERCEFTKRLVDMMGSVFAAACRLDIAASTVKHYLEFKSELHPDLQPRLDIEGARHIYATTARRLTRLSPDEQLEVARQFKPGMPAHRQCSLVRGYRRATRRTAPLLVSELHSPEARSFVSRRVRRPAPAKKEEAEAGS